MKFRFFLACLVGVFSTVAGQAARPDADYWTDPAVRKGLYVAASPDAGGRAEIRLGERRYCATGTNCYDLFLCSIGRNADGAVSFDLADSFETLDLLAREGVRIVRFNCGVYYAPELTAYTEHREAYLDALRQIAVRAEELKIGLIPSLIWHFLAVPTFFDEPLRSWGESSSRTSRFLETYTRDVVGALAGYKSIFAWEFGNEMNLQSDLPNWQTEFGRPGLENKLNGRDVRRAFEVFLKTVRRCDPDRRMTMSGNATLRPEQYHLFSKGEWKTDDVRQYAKMTKVFNPGKMSTVTEHVYESGREFADRGEVSLDEQLAVAMETAASLGKAYVVGEFGGVLSSEREYRKFYEAFRDAGVQLSLIWNFSLRGGIEHSFTADSPRGVYLFRLIREYDGKCGEGR